MPHAAAGAIDPAITGACVGLALLTAYQFLMQYEPWVLDLLEDPASALLEDQERAQQVAGRLGIEGAPVQSPGILEKQGVDFLFAYPAFVWEIVYI